MAALTALAIAGGVTAAAGGVAKIAAAGQAADAERRAAAAQEEFATKQAERMEKIRGEAVAASAPTVAEIQALDKVVQQRDVAIKQSMAEVVRFEETVKSIDPVIREASEQQFQLLKGRASDVLKPLIKNRERDRAKLEQQLSAQLGPSFKTSTAGMNAMMQFDSATGDLMSQAQFNAISQLSQTAQGAAATRGALSNQLAQISSIGSSLTFGELQARGNLQNRTLSAILNAPIPDVAAIGQARAGGVLADKTQAAGLAGLGGTLEGLGGTLLGFGLSGKLPGQEEKAGDILPTPKKAIEMKTSDFVPKLGRQQESVSLGNLRQGVR